MGTLVSWWMYEITRDAFYIGMIGLAEAIPAVGLSLYAGYIVDKTEKRKLLLRAVFLFGVCSIILLGTSTQWFQQAFGTKLIMMFIYIVIFCTGIIRSFSGPCFGAIIASLVPKHLLITAAQLSSTSWLIASITGHATTLRGRHSRSSSGPPGEATPVRSYRIKGSSSAVLLAEPSHRLEEGPARTRLDDPSDIRHAERPGCSSFGGLSRDLLVAQ